MDQRIISTGADRLFYQDASTNKSEEQRAGTGYPFKPRSRTNHESADHFNRRGPGYTIKKMKRFSFEKVTILTGARLPEHHLTRATGAWYIIQCTKNLPA
jgi:hypothetical protein